MSEEFRIVSPWSRDRDSLKGEGAVRYRSDCRKNVYDFAQLRRREISRLVVAGSVCGMIEREPDGVMRTADGPAWPRLVRGRGRASVCFRADTAMEGRERWLTGCGLGSAGETDCECSDLDW